MQVHREMGPQLSCPPRLAKLLAGILHILLSQARTSHSLSSFKSFLKTNQKEVTNLGASLPIRLQTALQGSPTACIRMRPTGSVRVSTSRGCLKYQGHGLSSRVSFWFPGSQPPWAALLSIWKPKTKGRCLTVGF